MIDPTGTYTSEDSTQGDPATSGARNIKLAPRQSAIIRNGVQRYQREKTRLGIPAMFLGEGLHGLMEYGSTSFPQALGLASTWDPALVKRVFTAVGDEAGSRGVGQVFSPVLDIARDPRWGRTEETYGEDPYLVSRMGVAAIDRLAGRLIPHRPPPRAGDRQALRGAWAAGRRHQHRSGQLLRAHHPRKLSGSLSGRHPGGARGQRDGLLQRDRRRALAHQSLAARQRSAPGVGLQRATSPPTATGCRCWCDTHHVAYNNADAARQGLAAGVDYDLSDGSVYRTLVDQVKQGIVPESEVDRAVARVLATKFRLGLFDNPYVDPDYAEQITNSEEHRKLAVEAARKVIVLLKNDKNLLPLDLAKLKTIAVIGPNAADVHLGGYSRDPGQGVSILDGIKRPRGQQGQGALRRRLQDHQRAAGLPRLVGQQRGTRRSQDADGFHSGRGRYGARRPTSPSWSSAKTKAPTAKHGQRMHLGDRDSLDLLGAQNDLVKAVVETGTPTMVLLLNGRPLSINYIAEKVPAILEGWYLGEEGGTAAAEVIFGDANPGGKLPITFPHTVGALPDFYNHKPTDNRSYEFSTRQPLFAFGYGLSYTTFKFDNLRVEPAADPYRRNGQSQRGRNQHRRARGRRGSAALYPSADRLGHPAGHAVEGL